MYVTPIAGSEPFLFSQPQLMPASGRLSSLYTGDVLEVIGKIDGWLQVKVKRNNLTGWVSSSLVVEINYVTLDVQQLRLSWPTDYKVITQAFGANPANYAKYGLPGHEGLDIRAPMGANVYACAPGEVYAVQPVTSGSAYGNHIRILHSQGYRTVYAHLESFLVKVGDIVIRGQLIAHADSTGNSSGAHLHLTLKHDGATKSGETHYPSDIIDPTPFMILT